MSGFSTVSDAQAAVRLDSADAVEAILVAIGPDQAVGSEWIDPMREVACWVRSAGLQAPPALFAVGREPLSSEAVGDALRKGAHVVVTASMIADLSALVQGQLFARAAWLAASSGNSNEPQENPEESQVTLHPKSTLAELPVNHPGWIPRPKDFAITEEDPIDLKVYEGKVMLRAIAAADGNRTLAAELLGIGKSTLCLLYTSPSPRDRTRSRMPSSA